MGQAITRTLHLTGITMKMQLFSIVLAGLALASTGCGACRNFLFGRGTACGLCAGDRPRMNIGPPMGGPPMGGPPCEPTCGGVPCGPGMSSYSPGHPGEFYSDGGYIDGGMIGNGVTYPEGYIPGVPVEGGSWAPRDEYIVPGSSSTMPQPSTTMGPVRGT